MNVEGSKYSPELLKDLLPVYYKRLFPYGPYYKWISYGHVQKTYFAHREFSFTLEDDIYLRYQSFADQAELEKEIQKRCPHKIDIGAVYSFRPKDHRTVSVFQPLEKELVFDIDMTDYDDVRSCCSGADICRKCWPFMTIAIKILDKALREDFGFDNILWIYSGRRGVHCWVCDEAARKLSVSARSAVAEYLQVIKGGENQAKKVSLSGEKTHPSIERAIDIIKHHFTQLCLRDQDILGDEVSWGKVLTLVPDEGLRKDLESSMRKYSTSVERWKGMKAVLGIAPMQGKTKKTGKQMLREIILQYTYPRLDINVSKGLNHLLKSPFCIHPKTGRVCVPIDPAHVEEFDPESVPLISWLIEEIDNYDAKSIKAGEDEVKRKVRDYKKTSLYKSIQIFEDFLEKLEKTWKGQLIQQADMKREF